MLIVNFESCEMKNKVDPWVIGLICVVGHTMTNEEAMHTTGPRHVAGNNSILLLFYPKTCLDWASLVRVKVTRLPSASLFDFFFFFGLASFTVWLVLNDSYDLT